MQHRRSLALVSFFAVSASLAAACGSGSSASDPPTASRGTSGAGGAAGNAGAEPGTSADAGASGGAGGSAGSAGAGGAGGTAGSGGTGGSAGAGGAGGAGGTGGAAGAGGGSAAGSPTLGGCPMFPADNPWNRDVSADPVDARSDAYVAWIQSTGSTSLHPDFGSDLTYGIPYNVVPGGTPKVPMTFDYESDPGPYPIPADPKIEAGGDLHVLVLDQGTCTLYETWDSHASGNGWQCGSGAIFDLRSNELRPEGWTSADAAGLPILPGLVRYDEAVTAGEIRHALRFTAKKTQAAYVHPATHFASSVTDPDAPPMGARFRLKASYDISGFTGASRAILVALKKYGMFLADNGGNWFITGASDTGFEDAELEQLKSVPGTAFEVVETGTLIR